jgi:hypothetical protein
LDVLLFNQEREANRDLRLRFELDEKLERNSGERPKENKEKKAESVCKPPKKPLFKQRRSKQDGD